METLIGGLSNWMVNPWLFAGGVVLVASPIIIHLLNKRRFRIVDWAAMDFLIEADKKNHRRVRLENLILLLLRCLAVLLIALLAARPFRSLGFAGGVLDRVRYERIVLLDDSLSMGIRRDDRTAFEAAKKGLEGFVDRLATRTESEDSLTIVLASRPQDRLPGLNAALVTDDTKAEIIQQIRNLKLSDRPVRFDAALAAVEKQLQGPSQDINRTVYVVSDFRLRDWKEDRRSSNQGVVAGLRKLAAETKSCVLVDVGSDDPANLAVTRIVPVNKAQVAGVETEFDVFVTNHGTRTVNDVPVRFTAGNSPAQNGTIASIPGGKTESIRFRYTFAAAVDADPNSPKPSEPVSIRAEVLTDARVADDQLPDDNSRFFAARVTRGIPVLLVDGDPSDDPNKSETFYLRRTLKPPVERSGDRRSEFAVKVISDDNLHAEKLDDYQIIYLCNIYRVGGRDAAAGDEPLADRLERWVRNGGRLVMILGDQVDEEFFNRELFRDGKGLSPVRLDGIRGDESEQSWTSFRIETPNHPVLKHSQADGESLLQLVKVFRWWAAVVPSPKAGEAIPDGKSTGAKGTVTVPLTFNDEKRTPALAEKTVGTGRVIVMTTACDADWSDWPQTGLNVPFMQDLSSHLTPRAADEGTLSVGDPLQFRFDLNDYETSAGLETPAGAKISLSATSGNAEGKGGKVASRLRQFEFNEAHRRGFYTMTLSRTDGRKESQLFASNVDADEGDLARLDVAGFQREVGDGVLQVVSIDGMATLGVGGEAELWLWVLLGLVAVLFLEQTLAWYFGTKR